MGRPLIIVLIIAMLLACPLRCLVCQTTATVANTDAPTSCCCCHETVCSDEMPVEPASSTEDCVCPNCLCEGATIPDGPAIPQLDFTVTLEAWFVPADRLIAGGKTSSPSEVNDPPGSILCGRDALVAYQSWLI